RSAQAAKETAAKIESAIGKTALGVEISDKVGKVLNDILSKARSVDELAAEVASASREQSQGIVQINTAVGQMDKITQSNAANAEESAGAAEELNAQAAALKTVVAELLELVGGSGEQMNKVPAAPEVSNSPKPPVKAVKKVAAPAPRSDTTIPMPVGTSNGKHSRNSIPMDGDFSDF
ncbi:MAG TPA: methyl-accepting chemotaxis protein, partial [Candidatus Paceibacterota bacterium]|nr:methyl-accepting chemotaxis protein [Candidatus Paceibacterota bacterium]